MKDLLRPIELATEAAVRATEAARLAEGTGRLADLRDPPLWAVLSSGVGLSRSQVEQTFGRHLGPRDASHFLNLWVEHNLRVARFQGRGIPSELRGEPLSFPRAVAKEVGVPGRSLERLARLDYDIRLSLASERELTLPVGIYGPRKIRMALLRSDLPVLSGTVPVRLDLIDRLLVRLETSVERLDERDWLREGLVLLETVRGFKVLKGWRHRPSLYRTVREVVGVAPGGSNRTGQMRLVLLASLLDRGIPSRGGDDLFAGLPERAERASFWDLMVVASNGLNISIRDLLRAVYGRDQRYPTMGRGLEELSVVVPLLNLLHIARPWEILGRLYPDELRWGFGIPSDRPLPSVFLIDGRTDLAALREGGFGRIESAARQERAWNLRELAARASARSREPVTALNAGAYGRNTEQPTFNEARAIIEALNEDTAAASVDPAAALLAAEPNLIDLLPVGERGTRRLISMPTRGLRRYRPYAAAPLSLVYAPTVRRALDPLGFPRLIQTGRRELGLFSIATAAQRLQAWGVTPEYIDRMEEDPAAGDTKVEIPSRRFIWAVTSPTGLGRRLAVALAAHRHSYWPNDPVVELLVNRTFRTPVFIDGISYPRLVRFAAQGHRTTAEVLYYFRNRAGSVRLNNGFQFPADEAMMARLFTVYPQRYRAWEIGTIIPNDQEVERVESRLQLTKEEKRILRDAVRQDRRVLLSHTTTTPVPVWANETPGLPHFLTLVKNRTTLDPRKSEAKILEKLAGLSGRDRDSLLFIGRTAAPVTDPFSVEVGTLIGVLHNTDRLLDTWPAAVTREGPLAAVYYVNADRHRPIDDLTRHLHNPRLRGIEIDPESGEIEYRWVPPPRAYDPTVRIVRDEAAASVVGDEERGLLIRLLSFLRRERLLATREELAGFADKITRLAAEDPLAYQDFIRAVDSSEIDEGRWDPGSWDPIRRTLYSTHHFLEMGAGRFTWDGSPFDFYRRNRGNRTARMLFSNALGHGNVTHVSFHGRRAEFVRTGRGPATGMRGGSYSYAEAAEVRFLPRPGNDWGRGDLRMPEARLKGLIVRFFDGVERRLRANGGELQRRTGLGSNYFSIRKGEEAMTARSLSDEVLDRLSLNPAQKEELRHLETLLALSRDITNGPQRGPYHWPAVLFRYYRLLNQIPINSVRGVMQGESGIETCSEIELGRVALLNRDRVAAIAAAVGVPIGHRAQFVDYVMRVYEEAHRGRVVAPAEGVVEFPNDRWDIPFNEYPRDRLQRGLATFATEIRGGMDETAFKRATGFDPAEFYAAERRGQIGPQALDRYLTYLRRDGREDDADHLRMMRIALELKYNPVPDRTAYHRAGQFIRFMRAMIPGGRSTIRDLIGRRGLNLDVSATAYTRWEWGFVEMPPPVVERFADYMVRQKVIQASQRNSLVAHINALYERVVPS